MLQPQVIADYCFSTKAAFTCSRSQNRPNNPRSQANQIVDMYSTIYTSNRLTDTLFGVLQSPFVIRLHQNLEHLPTTIINGVHTEHCTPCGECLVTEIAVQIEHSLPSSQIHRLLPLATFIHLVSLNKIIFINEIFCSLPSDCHSSLQTT